MHEWLDWARGPLFRFAFAFMVLGLVRLVALNVLGLRTVLAHAHNRELPVMRWLGDTVRWGLPVGKVPRHKLLFVGASMLFHAALLVVPVFLGAHVLLWQRSVGVSWPTLGNQAADILTLLGLLATLLLLIERLVGATARALSRGQDYAFLLLIGATLASGYLAMHPWMNPFSYDAAMLVHVLTGNAIFVLLPFSKLSHAILFPFNRLAAELGWRLAPGAGQAVAAAIGKESESV